MPYQNIPDTQDEKVAKLESEGIKTEPEFVHSSEATFARILDYYGIEWEYEPRTFPLVWDDQGNVTEAFSPDFYLPNQDIYIELTTLRPKLTTIKNQKIRRMRKLYPEINVKLFKRRDLRALMIKFGLDDQASQIAGTDTQKDGS